MLPAPTGGVFAHAPGGDRDQGDDGSVEPVKELFGVGQRPKAIVKNRQSDHHQHGRQDETRERDTGAAPAAQAKSHVSDGVAGAGAGQALAERESFDEVMLAKPAPLLDDDMSDVSQDGKAAAKSGQTDFEK